MAESEQIILDIDTGASVRNIAELQALIKAYKEQLKDTGATYEQNRQTVEGLARAQNALRDAMHTSTMSLEEARKPASLVGKSYNDLVHQMSELTKVWRETSDVTAREDIGRNINQINNELKRLDATRGNFQRNVGNYGNELGAAFTHAGSVLGGPFAQGVNTANMGLKTLAANPIMAIVMVAGAILNKIIESIKGVEESSNGLSEAFAALAPVGDSITKIFQAIGKGAAWLVDKMVKLKQAVFGVTEAEKERVAIAKMQNDLTAKMRENTVKIAEAERDAARMKAEAAAKDKHTTEERIALLEGAAEKENEIAKRTYEQAQLEYEIIKRKNKLTGSSAEEKQAEADAQAKMIRAETTYYTKIKETAGQLAEARKKMADDAKKYHDERLRQIAEMTAAERAAALEEIKNSELRLQIQANLLEKGSKDYLKAMAKLRKAQYDNLMQGEEESDAAFNARRLTAARAYAEAVNAVNAKAAEESTIALRLAYAESERTEEQTLAFRAAMAENAYNTMRRKEGESADEFRIRQLDAQKAYVDASVALVDHQKEKEKAAAEEVVAAQKKKIEAAQGYLQMTATVAGGVSALIGSLADVYEADGESSQEQLQKAKNMRIAGATIDMISGVVMAISNAMQLGPILGPIMGAINAATVTAAGIANISKIKAQDVSGNSSTSVGAPAAVNAPAVSMDTPMIRTLTGASEEARLNKMASDQKVYLVTSELEAKQAGNKVRVAEATFGG